MVEVGRVDWGVSVEAIVGLAVAGDILVVSIALVFCIALVKSMVATESIEDPASAIDVLVFSLEFKVDIVLTMVGRVDLALAMVVLVVFTGGLVGLVVTGVGVVDLRLVVVGLVVCKVGLVGLVVTEVGVVDLRLVVVGLVVCKVGLVDTVLAIVV